MSASFNKYFKKRLLVLKTLWFVATFLLLVILFTVYLLSESYFSYIETGISEIVLIVLALFSALISFLLSKIIFTKSSLKKALSKEEEVSSEKIDNTQNKDDLTTLENKVMNYVEQRFTGYFLIFLLQLFLNLDIVLMGSAMHFLQPSPSVGVFLPFFLVSLVLQISIFPNMQKVLNRAKTLAP